MSKAFKKFRTKLAKTSVVVTAGLITYSMAHGAEFGFGEILEIENNNKEDSSIIQDKVNGNQVIEGLETVFYKRNNELKIKWDKVDSAQAYRIYKIKDKNCKDVLDGKNLVLLDEVETNKIKINDVRVIGSPKINIVNRESKDIELAIEMENEETEYGIYIEAIDEEKNVIAKSDMSLVKLGDKLLGYSYKVTYSEDAKVDSKVDAGVSEKINISLSNKSKYIHIKGVYESGASSDVTVYELPIKDKETSNSIVNIGSRLSGYIHKNTPSTWTNKSVDINVSATSSVGFKSIKKPNGEVIDFKTSDLHLVGGDKYDLYSNIKPTKDGGFIVSGKSASSEIEDKSIEPGKKFTINNKGGTDGLIVKYSKDNKIEMVSSWGTANDDAFYNVTEVIKNGIVDGYMAVGQTVTSEGRKRGLVVMFNKDGTVRWRDIIEEGPDRSTIEEAMWSVIQDSRGNLIVAGWVDASTNFDPDPYILKYNPDSSTPIKVVSEDRDRPDENHWEHETIDSIAETKDGGYVAVGRSMVYDHSIGRYTDDRGLIIKYDKDFNVEWSDTFGGDYDTTRGFDFDNAIIASNGDIVVTGDGDALKSNNAGEIVHDSKGGRDGFLVRYDSKTGEIKWQTRFGGSQDEQIYSVYELANGDLISTGYTKSTDGDFSGTLSNGMDGHDAFIMTFDGSTGERKGGVTRIGGAGKDMGWWTGMLNDGRLVTVGETTSAGSVNTDAFLAFPMGATSVNVLYNVDENGEYVFEFTDILGKKREYVAEVTNIEKSPPVIKLSHVKGVSEDYIKVDVTDNVGVQSIKWSVGKKDVAYFRSSGNNLTGNRIDNVTEAYYTVYAKDLAGNESVESIRISKAKDGDNAGNGGETLHYKISSPGGNTDYSVNNGRVTNLDGVSVSKVMKKGAYKYAFDIKNLTGTPFIETFGGSKNEHIYDTIVHDGDYVSVGHSVSNDYDFKGMNKGREDIFVVKHNNKGELIWKKTFGGSIDEYAMSVSLEEDGYIIVGYTISRDGDFSQVQNGNANGYIMKLDFDGNIIWNNTVYAHDWDMFNDFVKRDDGGYIVVGSTQSHPGYSSSDTNDIMVVGISEDGKTEYIKYIGGNYRDRGERIINNKDGTYTIIGQSFSTRGMASHKGGEDGVLVKIDNNGNVLKCKNFGGSGDDHFRQVYQMDNGDFVVVGYTESNDKNLAGVKTTTDRDGLVVLFDKNWNVKWVKTVGGTKNEWLLDVYVDDTGIMTAGFGGSNDGEFAGMNKGGEDAIVVRFSLDGEKEWIRSFGGSGEERLRTMVRTPEGGYLIGGDTTSIDGDLNGIVNRGSQDALLVKFNQDGTFGILSQDNEISEVKYKIETNKSGIRKLVTEGVYTNEVVNPGEKKTKTVDFTVPDIDAEEIVITTQLKDDQDTTSSNNKIETRVPINQGVGTDYALKNDKVIDQNRVEKDEVEIGLEYRYNFDVLNTDTAPFIKTFGGSGNEHFEKHIITSDGGILAVGRTNSNNGDLKGMNKGGTDALIVKYDHHGNVEWKDSYGSSGNEMFYHVAEFSDCYIAVGQYNGKENLIVKYNKANGKVLKDKRYLDAGLSSSRAIIIQANSDDSFYVAASSYDPTDGSIGPSYSKFDKNLDPVWTQHLHQSGDSGATAIYGLDIGENSGDIYVTGKFGKATGAFAGLQAKGSMDAFVLRASATNGKVKWIKSFTGTDVDDGRQVAETLDGSIIVIGRTMSGDGDFAGMKKPLDNRSFASGSIASDSAYRRQDGWVARMNASNGKVEKIKTIGGGGYDNLRYLMRMKDGSFLISGDTASLDGDFSGRVVKDNGYSDTVWIKMDKNLNITWISILGGNNDDATQSGIELPDGSIVVAGETKSTTGDFAGLNNGGQDAFIARLNADGELEMYPHDEMISQIKYDFTWSDGNKEYPIKSGSIDDVKVPVGRTVNKEVAFEVPRDSRIKTITMSAEIHDSLDVNENNNRISKTVNVDIPRDYLFEGYNVKEKGKTALQGTLRKNTEYELNLKLANRYIGTEKTRGWFLQRNVASTQSLYMPKIDSLKYKIVSTDGIESQEVNRITLNNVKGTVLAQGEKKNIEVADQDSVWEKISFKTLDDESMSEVIFVAEISSLDDGNPNNNRFVVKLPILNKINPEIYIENVVVYPNGGDNGKLVIGNEINVKVTLGANTLKTNEADVKLKITDGNETVELNKKAFSISKEYPGVVYFKYKPNSIGRLRVVAEVSSDYGTEVFNSVYAQVEKPKEIKHYEEQGTKSNDNYDIPAEVVTYLKVQKRDKDAVKVKKCVDESHCQQDFNGRLQCPGHEYYDWGDWYNAFIPVKATELRGYEEKYEIKKVLFRSKETEKLKGKGVEGVDNDGMVDLMDEEKSNLALVKAGYGFELRTETEYKNNLPKLLEKASVSNIAPSDTSWSQYKIIPHAGQGIPFIYYSEELNGTDELILSNKGAVSFTVPSLDDIIIENPDQLYIKMPDGEYIIVDEGYGESYGDEVATKLEVVDDSEKLVSGDAYYDRKVIEFKKSSGGLSGKRNYYISDNVSDGEHEISIFNRYSGYGPAANNKLHVKNKVKVTVKGGKYDDIIDMGQ